MLRSQLFHPLGQDVDAPDVEITGVTADSRAVEDGFVFVAIAGHEGDGHDFAAEAAARGARAIVCERPVAVGVPFLIVEDSRLALSRLAAAFFGHPADRVRTVGVTGTKGKTTITWLIRSIVRQTRYECGVLGTMGKEAFGATADTGNTTPDPMAIHGFLAELDRPDGGYAAIEVSSHALCQGRVHGLPFRVGVFTNLSGEHLDYHESMDAYLEAKAQLFDVLAPEATAVINARQRELLPRLLQTPARALLFGVDLPPGASPQVVATDLVRTATGTRFQLHLPGHAPQWVTLSLLGRHNVENALAAAAATLALGIDPKAIVRGLEAVHRIPGRLEPVDAGQPFHVLIDYAHTDDALEKVLTALRPVAADGRLICVFGCGGDRDRTKRPRMAAVAERLADQIVVTSDNPRTEDPRAILDDILAGLDRPAAAEVQVCRRRAIACALLAARAGDVVVIAGKGHETYQILGREKQAFDDREVARDLLERILDRPTAPRTATPTRPHAPAPHTRSGRVS